MTRSLLYLLSLPVILLISGACNHLTSQVSELYIVMDLTPENVYTSGIEGPAVDDEGNIYIVNFQEQGTIGRTNPQGHSELFVRLPEGSIGNGIRLDRDGALLVADYTGHNVLRINPATKAIAVYAHNSEMNQPNDLAISEDGTIYASDPNWSESTGNLWRITNDGSSVLLESDMGTTNGVEVSPDGGFLYVNESVQRNVWKYRITPEGISDKQLFHQFEDHGMDGMRCDTQGNLYITRYGKGTVAILSPSGELVREVMMKGKKTSNIAFGGPDGRTAYVTLQDRGCVETFRTEFPGRSFKMWLDK